MCSDIRMEFREILNTKSIGALSFKKGRKCVLEIRMEFRELFSHLCGHPVLVSLPLKRMLVVFFCVCLISICELALLNLRR